MFQNLDVI